MRNMIPMIFKRGLAALFCAALLVGPLGPAFAADEEGHIEEHGAADSHAYVAEGEHGEHQQGGAHHAPEPYWNELGAAIINFTLYVGLIVFFARKPVRRYFENRRSTITAEIEKSKKMREEAEAQLAEYSKKLEAFDAEREEILAEYRKMGEREKERIIEAAREQAERITADAGYLVEREVHAERAKLEQRLVDEAIGLARAEVQKQLSDSRQVQLIDAYISELERTDDALDAR